jgi:hypothetical protein
MPMSIFRLVFIFTKLVKTRGFYFNWNERFVTFLKSTTFHERQKENDKISSLTLDLYQKIFVSVSEKRGKYTPKIR